MDNSTHDAPSTGLPGSEQGDRASGPATNSSPRRLLATAWGWIGDVWVVALALVVGAVFGWMYVDDEPLFAERPASRHSDVLELISLVGVVCSEPLDTADVESGVMSTCRGTDRFSLHVADSIEEAYVSFDLASQLGCYTVGNLPHPKFFLARSATWTLLTHDRGVAEALLRIRGVTVTTGRCEVPNTGRPE